MATSASLTRLIDEPRVRDDIEAVAKAMTMIARVKISMYFISFLLLKGWVTVNIKAEILSGLMFPVTVSPFSQTNF